MEDITASIVLYNTNIQEVHSITNTLLKSERFKHLYIIDNSPSPISEYSKSQKVSYIFNGKNLGYGIAHNIAIKKAIKENSKYHIVMNTDIEFSTNVLPSIAQYMDTHTDVGQIMPKVSYKDGNTQYLCKLIPNPFDLFVRRFLPSNLFNASRDKFILKESNYNRIMNIPCLSGCFMFLRIDTLKEIGLFDERYFLYMEDFDLTRRIHNKYKTIFYPHCKIVHHERKGSYKKLKLLFYHAINAIKYFNKWGWIFDKERNPINNSITNNYISQENGYKKMTTR